VEEIGGSRKGSDYYYEIPELKRLLSIDSEESYLMNFRDSIGYTLAEIYCTYLL
jgi:hypothetical protein